MNLTWLSWKISLTFPALYTVCSTHLNCRVQIISNNVDNGTDFVNIDTEKKRGLVPINSCQLSTSDMVIYVEQLNVWTISVPQYYYFDKCFSVFTLFDTF